MMITSDENSVSALQQQFQLPLAVNDAEIAFGGGMDRLLPAYSGIPRAFEGKSTWLAWQGKWFGSGLEPEDIPKPKDGVELRAALRHLSAIQTSFQPKHEHKVAAVAWLANLWFEIPADSKAREH